MYTRETRESDRGKEFKIVKCREKMMDLESAGEVRNRAGRSVSTLLGHRGEPVAAAPLSH